jgi:hypothetical protein
MPPADHWASAKTEIGGRDTLDHGAANGSAGVNSASGLGEQRCG